MDDAAKAEFLNQMRTFVGATGSSNPARDPVNQPMIRHWCDAMEDANPNYTDPAAAAGGVHGQVVAPPTMLNAWTMIGHIPRVFGIRLGSCGSPDTAWLSGRESDRA